MATRHTCLESVELGAFYGGVDMILYAADKFWTVEVENKDKEGDAAIHVRFCPYCGIRLPNWEDGDMLWNEFRKVQHIRS